LQHSVAVVPLVFKQPRNEFNLIYLFPDSDTKSTL